MSLELLPAAVRDVTRSPDERARALIDVLTLEEKVGQLLHDAPAIERLGIPPHNWWNECSHGVARAGATTVFPHAIAQAATFNTVLIQEMGSAIADEARAKHHDAARRGSYKDYEGLTFWTPNINIARDPRWGRIQETYGEDPYLTGQMAVALIRGMQGDDPRYLKIAACAKHYAAHSGPEAKRHEFNATVSAHDLWDTYLPAFEACVREAQVESIMGAYSRTNGEPCSASPTLLEHILRERWGFGGHVVSDCGAIEDLVNNHKLVATYEAAAAMALNQGCDLICGCLYDALLNAAQTGMVSAVTLERALMRVLLTRFRLGMFDSPEQVAYTQIPVSVVGCEAHRQLALRTAQESIVLLKNAGDLLPLSKTGCSIAVIGPNADAVEVLLGNYYGTPIAPVTLLNGIRRVVAPETQVTYSRGCPLAADDTSEFSTALALADETDVVVFVGGLSQVLEGENLQTEGVPPGTVSAGDRTSLELPAIQQSLLRRLHEVGKPIILVIVSGSAVSLPWEAEHLAAIIQAWYPGEQGGQAVADVLFGDYNPAGRLPLTVYRSLDDVPPFEDYAMRGRTYRYATKAPLYPFGFGLSYTRFAYTDLKVSASQLHPGDRLKIEAVVTNNGDRAGEEVVQLYVTPPQPDPYGKLCELHAFQRIHLQAGEMRCIRFMLASDAFQQVNETGERVFLTGDHRLFVGGGQPGYAPGVSADLWVAAGSFAQSAEDTQE
jgi:beta-glucosidase